MINASDLAASKEEEEMVIHYVKDQLTLLGIRFPRIFPVSSRKSLVEKQTSGPVNQEMTSFEEAFFRFIHHDLTTMLVKGVLFDIERAKRTVDNLLAAARVDENEKQQQRTRLLKNQELMEQTINDIDVQIYAGRVSQKNRETAFFILSSGSAFVFMICSKRCSIRPPLLILERRAGKNYGWPRKICWIMQDMSFYRKSAPPVSVLKNSCSKLYGNIAPASIKK
ncbi:hypothetical protein RWE15_23060 [Virgibacillus halophilus]|uniref:Uncharacterized protein n=1 Tax=Tigheibacillus halophilus TaxID=361280 RepID=A0ABU5CBF6_9BACI|nr:hypothetical protein [Virgibacillus halophilus]